MFLKRLVTGLILSIVTILAIYFLSVPIFVTAFTLFMLLAALEWTILMDCKSFWSRLSFIVFVAVLMYLSTYIPILFILWGTFGFWLVSLFLIIVYPKNTKIWGRGIWIRGLMGAFALVPTWLTLNQLRLFYAPAFIIFMLLLIWGVDTGSYAAGKWFGKHKLIPKVSPNKTLEGLWGGLILPLMVAVVGCLILKIPFERWLLVMGLTLFTSIFAVIGDLSESMLKRQIGLKDLGQYLPGHGGMLDRIDSLMAAAPMFLLALIMINR
ncbi:MAG: phosphatidate cytidylyltransferase [Gammaproteobacteria bacterium]|nr:phosphatidate cytidylyltransferase [Gammaproteobacteria bacterium]